MNWAVGRRGCCLYLPQTNSNRKVANMITVINVNGLRIATSIVFAVFLFSPVAKADVIVNAQGTVTESTQVVPGTLVNFTARVNGSTPDNLPAFDSIGAFQDNPIEYFTLQIGVGDNSVLIEGGPGGEIGTSTNPDTTNIFISISDFAGDVTNITGLPPEFTFSSFSFNIDSETLQNDLLIDSLNATNGGTGTFNAGISPTSASGPITQFSVTPVSVPEPSSCCLLILIGTVVVGRRARNA